jgi:hypothetical protein
LRGSHEINENSAWVEKSHKAVPAEHSCSKFAGKEQRYYKLWKYPITFPEVINGTEVMKLEDIRFDFSNPINL